MSTYSDIARILNENPAQWSIPVVESADDPVFLGSVPRDTLDVTTSSYLFILFSLFDLATMFCVISYLWRMSALAVMRFLLISLLFNLDLSRVNLCTGGAARGNQRCAEGRRAHEYGG